MTAPSIDVAQRIQSNPDGYVIFEQLGHLHHSLIVDFRTPIVTLVKAKLTLDAFQFAYIVKDFCQARAWIGVSGGLK
jgi:hypothetical protein